MPRPEKVQAVAEIKERLERAQAVFLAEYAGLSVKEQQTLRRGLREGGAEFKVVKMTLARRAAAELELADLDELFLGPTGIAFADGDPVPAAKALKEFAKENEALVVKGGLLGSEFLTPERISELADIESREVLLSRIAGAMQAPMAKMAGLLEALPRNLASAMKQLMEKKEEAGDVAPAAAADEAAPAEEPADDTADKTSVDDTSVDDTSVDDTSVDEAPVAEAAEETPAADEAPAEEASGEVAEAATEDETGEAEASEAEASDDTTAEAEEEPKAGDDAVEASDGDDAKSSDEDPAAEAEEE